MQKFELIFDTLGERAVLIKWPNKIDDKILDDIIQFTASILKYEGESLLNYTPGYNSILLQYKSKIELRDKQDLLLKIYNSNLSIEKKRPKSWEIPVCYDEIFGLDLHLFSEAGISKNEVEHIHSTKKYRVFMIGFLPGFLYLGGLSNKLHMDRKKNPRSMIPKGSVAIGGKQTGIYPINSPGGWQIIGRTPISLFDPNLEIPCHISQGDYIQFIPISIEEYQDMLPKQIKTYP